MEKNFISKLEGCFKILKDPSLRLNQIFLKRIDRIQALLSILTLCLFINRIGQTELRQTLALKKDTVPKQIGIDITKPTLKWAFQLMSKVIKLKVKFSDKLYEEYKGYWRGSNKNNKLFW
jgi:transposase